MSGGSRVGARSARPPRYSYSPSPLSESLDPPLDIGHFWDLKG